MENFELKTIRKPAMDYQEFIETNTNPLERMQILLNLHEMTTFYYKNGITDAQAADYNTKLTSKSTLNWAFEVYKMKKAIFSGTPHKFNLKITPSLSIQANNVFLLAMLYSRSDIVEYFLNNKLIEINQSIFRTQHWPSYFLIACTCSDQIFNLFKGYKIKYSVGWNGLTAHIISSYKSRPLPKTSYIDFITYKQYELLLKFRSIEVKESFEQLPIFPLDFACMNKDRTLIRDILEAVPEAGTLTRLSFIVQKEENLYLILSKYDFRGDQSFNGETPLHFSCYSGDLCALSMLLNLGFPIIKNYDSKWPHEVGNEKTKEKATVFFNLCTKDSTSNSQSPRKVFNQRNFEEKMIQWMEVLKFNPKDYDKYCGIFRYIKFNKNHKILTNSRFNIINLITMSKTPVEVEAYIKKMVQCPFYEKVYDEEKTLYLYNRLLYGNDINR